MKINNPYSILLLTAILLLNFTTFALAALPNDGTIKLTIKPGEYICLDGTSYPDPGCEAPSPGEGVNYVRTVINGSYSNFPFISGNHASREILEGDRDIVLGRRQPYSDHPLRNNITKPWFLQGTTSVNYTALAITVDNNDTVDMSGWRLYRWAQDEIINLGNGIESTLVCTSTEGVSRATGDCQIGDSYVLDYTADTIFFSQNDTYVLHLEGTIEYQAANFVDATNTAGITYLETNSFLSSVWGGIAWIDYNNDDYPDLFIPSL